MLCVGVSDGWVAGVTTVELRALMPGSDLPLSAVQPARAAAITSRIGMRCNRCITLFYAAPRGSHCPKPHSVPSPMISVEGLRKSLRTGSATVDILKGIDFTVAKGEFVAIMGASGSGKSTLLGLLAGLDNPTSGDVRLNGIAISYLAEDKLAQLRGRTIGFVFQSYQLIPTLTALENVLLPYELNDESGAAKIGLERARQLLTSVGLEARMDHYPIQLSGGEQQRVALARAFILRPPIVLADEPTGNLDTTNGQHILELLLSLNRTEGTTLVLVTHDPALAAHASRRITLRDGLVVSDEPILNGDGLAHQQVS